MSTLSVDPKIKTKPESDQGPACSRCSECKAHWRQLEGRILAKYWYRHIDRETHTSSFCQSLPSTQLLAKEVSTDDVRSLPCWLYTFRGERSRRPVSGCLDSRMKL
ncbi:hypothetical protein BDN67DRAFT_969686 [Paxillus ammoniavirescens]|nr:hypothetical protein BDN67DRAFT_969686 [Paxillus ammoniavirescens]